MYLLLIRHLESEKNARESFSSDSDREMLTESARRDLASWASSVVDWVHSTGAAVARIHSTASTRAQDTAASIAEGLTVPVVSYECLRSTHPGSLAGKSAEDARQSNPEFMEQLRLYRKGLFNSYDFTVAESKEPKRTFEARIATCIEQIMRSADEDLKIVVSHRAPITATLIAAARRSYNYPASFSGYVELTLGHSSLLERGGAGDWRIHDINVPTHELPQLSMSKNE